MSHTLALISYLVRDYAEAIAYFTTTLSFALTEDRDLGEGKRWVVVTPRGPAGAALLLARAATPEQASRIGDQTGGRVAFFLHTDDFWRDYYAWRAGGVTFEETPRTEAYGVVAVFRDLYGNRWDLLELRTPSATLTLREVEDADLDVFFAQQLDPEANWLAAFTAPNPTDRAAFDAHWARIRRNATVLNRTIVVDGQVVGSVASYAEAGRTEVSYWLGREAWGRGYATRALAEFLKVQAIRPLYARVAHDNLASQRVLARNGFVVIGEERGYANARGAEITEHVLRREA